MPKLDFVRQNVLEFYALEHGQLHCLMCRQKFPVNGQHYECCARPRTDQLENHLLDVEFHDHEFTIAQIRAGRHQLFDVQVYSQEQREKDVLNFIVNHGFSFRTIEDPIFQKLTNVYHTRQWFADTLRSGVISIYFIRKNDFLAQSFYASYARKDDFLRVCVPYTVVGPRNAFLNQEEE
ncbi:Hypothetical_protein [Hexamita inflata]|uniref:Hypothetical_protein n=1 Tax=Hexamita inflata TaxID=28002 RepID=A0AA86QSV8_9EUKA|nr:Hypothetical protein HINF_LOCUS50112 [Hexamita inflata]